MGDGLIRNGGTLQIRVASCYPDHIASDALVLLTLTQLFGRLFAFRRLFPGRRLFFSLCSPDMSEARFLSLSGRTRVFRRHPRPIIFPDPSFFFSGRALVAPLSFHRRILFGSLIYWNGVSYFG